jgi:hypothetical protein
MPYQFMGNPCGNRNAGLLESSCSLIFLQSEQKVVEYVEPMREFPM